MTLPILPANTLIQRLADVLGIPYNTAKDFFQSGDFVHAHVIGNQDAPLFTTDVPQGAHILNRNELALAAGDNTIELTQPQLSGRLWLVDKILYHYVGTAATVRVETEVPTLGLIHNQASITSNQSVTIDFPGGLPIPVGSATAGDRLFRFVVRNATLNDDFKVQIIGRLFNGSVATISVSDVTA